jgi:hypothetical protein
MQNVVYMREAGDNKTSDLYAQISADEINHVRLGIRWCTKIHPGSLDRLLSSVRRKAQKIVPEAQVPIVAELKSLCGFPKSWVQREVKRKSHFPLLKVHRAIG